MIGGRSMFPEFGWVYLFIHWFVVAAALLITAFVVPGFSVKNFKAALIAALVIGILNVTIRPFLLFLSLPINILTLGLFTFVVNAIVLKLCAALIRDFDIRGWGSALLGAIILSVVGYFIRMAGL